MVNISQHHVRMHVCCVQGMCGLYVHTDSFFDTEPGFAQVLVIIVFAGFEILLWITHSLTECRHTHPQTLSECRGMRLLLLQPLQPIATLMMDYYYERNHQDL